MNIIHIGLPKAASTTLQNTVFAEQKRFVYVGPFNSDKSSNNSPFPHPRVEELVMSISVQNSLEYDLSRAKSLVEGLRQGSRPFLVSSEGFSSEGRADRRLIADRLHELFAPAKILIVLRSQPSLCQSMYLNYLRASGERTVTFDQWLDDNYGGIIFRSVRVGLDYDRLVETYEDVFGADNVLVLAFEMIRDENSPFSSTIAHLLDMPLATVQGFFKYNANARMSRRHLFAVRIQDYLPKGTNLALLGRRWMPQPLYRIIRQFVVSGQRVDSPPVPERWNARIFELCATGNAQLERRKNLPLRALGYPVIGDGRPTDAAH